MDRLTNEIVRCIEDVFLTRVNLALDSLDNHVAFLRSHFALKGNYFAFLKVNFFSIPKELPFSLVLVIKEPNRHILIAKPKSFNSMSKPMLLLGALSTKGFISRSTRCTWCPMCARCHKCVWRIGCARRAPTAPEACTSRSPPARASSKRPPVAESRRAGVGPGLRWLA